MKKTLLKNLNIINPCNEPAFIENAFVAIGGESIESVGKDKPSGSFDVVHDLHDKIALPGMINAHHHLYSALAVGMPLPKGNPTNFTEILQEVWWKMDLALDRDSTQACFESGLLDSLKAGTTTVIDHHCSPSFIEGSLTLLAESAEKFGMNSSVAFEITDRNGPEKFEASLQENIAAVQKYGDNPYVHPLIGLHASFTLSDDSLHKIRQSVEPLKSWGIHIHVSEDKADEEDAIKKGYASVLKRLEKFDLLNENAMIIHGLHISEADLSLLKKYKLQFVHNPSSNANNRVGMAPNINLDQLRSGLGTDGMQGNMLREGKEGMLIRSSHLSGGAESANYLQLLFENNPAIASKLFNKKLGKILPEYQADLAIFDYHPRTPITESTIFGHIFFGLSSLPSEVMTRGVFSIRDYQLQNISEKEIKANAALQAARLWSHLS
ncbi:MAG: amidohydrolase family protein [SAR324 cluster bacterium]|nr:amidohydrolase family protein [SAR324 cluster bacterium]MBL7034249.1 amidohydrolase family protein [SAR324 cluster bacterium]